MSRGRKKGRRSSTVTEPVVTAQVGRLEPRRQFALHLVLGMVIVAAGIAVYANSFSGVLLFDDTRHIVHNESIRHLWPIWDHLHDKRRPMVSLSLAVNYALGSLNVWGYHAFNLAVHLLAGLTLFGVVRRTLLSERLSAWVAWPRLRGHAKGRHGHASVAMPPDESMPERRHRAAAWLAFVAALLWVVHPLNTQSVTYIIQRGESMMGLFYLLTLYCVIRGAVASTRRHRRWWFVAAVVSCALGMGSKAVMVTAPVVVLIYDRIFLVSREGGFGELLRRRWGLYLGLVASWSVLVWCGVVRGVFDASPAEPAGVGLGVANFTPLRYALTQPGVILHYLRLCFWPHPLCLDYDWPAAAGAGTIAGPLIVVGLLVLASIGALLWRRTAALGFCGVWFFVILAPTSSVMPVMDPIFEHRMYLSLAGVIVLVVVGVYAVLARLLPSLPAVVVAAGLTMAAACVLGVLTYQRNHDYHDSEAMWRDVLAMQPRNARAMANLGKTLSDQGRLDEAEAWFTKSLEIKPDDSLTLYGLGIVLKRQGHPLEAVEQHRKALALAPENGRIHYALANALSRAGRHAEAIEHYMNAIALIPDFAEAHVNCGIALGQLGRLDEAVAQYRQALEIAPEHAIAHYNLGLALVRQGRPDEAMEHYRAVFGADLRWTNPGMVADAHCKVGKILHNQGKIDEAIREYEAALRIDPESPAAELRLQAVNQKR